MKRKLLLIVASLLVSSVMFAQDFHWSGFNIHDYQTNMNVTGRAYLDGVLVTDRGDIEVAAFVGDELRGTKYLVNVYPSSNLGYFVYTNCFFNTEGETFTFKAFDHASGIEYDICPTQLIGQQDGHGNVDNPIEMRFTRTVEPTYGPEYPWTPSTAYSGEGMAVTAQIQINGQLVDRATYEVGAFCGEECRGTSGAQGLEDFTDDELGYFAMMNVMGNNGDIINFYLYDHQSNEVVAAVCNTVVELENGAEVGIDIFGGGIFVLNFLTVQTFTKEIAAYTEDGGYYLIATPIGTVNPADVDNMMENDYDLYYFDQASADGKEWVNIKNGNTDLVSLKGYLYANSEDVTLTFTGYMYDGDGEVELVKNVGDNTTTSFEGWNLVGNPFAQTAYITKPFYTMNNDGSEVVAGTGNSVDAMEGIFVVATTDGETMTFSKEESGKGNEQIVINVLRDRGAAIDRAIVRFDGSEELPKFMLNESHTKLYIPQGMDEYAVVQAQQMGEIPVNFKAAQGGVYTLSFNIEEVNFCYLHLIDNLTGADVDLLALMRYNEAQKQTRGTASYSFSAQAADYASRFKLVFAVGDNDDDEFSFYNNGLWIINNDGEAILQVIDVTGRIMSSRQIEGSYSLSLQAAHGVYMLRLIKGDDVKVQKIVVE